MQLILETDALDTNMSNYDVDEKIVATNGLENIKNGDLSKANGKTKTTILTDDIDEISVENRTLDKEDEKNCESAHESDQSTEPVKESKADLVDSNDIVCGDNSFVPLLNASDSVEKPVSNESDSTENKHEDVAEQDKIESENHATDIKENGEENNKEEECQIEENINEKLPNDTKSVIENVTNVLENNTQPDENTDADDLITFETTDDNSKNVDPVETDFKRVEKSPSFDGKESNKAPIENILNEVPLTNVVEVEKVIESSTTTQSINFESENGSYSCTEDKISQDNNTKISIITAKSSTDLETMDCVTDENIEDSNKTQSTHNDDIIYIDDGKNSTNNDIKECEKSMDCDPFSKDESLVEVDQNETVDAEKGVKTESTEQYKPVVSTLSSDSSDDCVEVKEFLDDRPKSVETDNTVKEKEIEGKITEKTLDTVEPDVVTVETDTITEKNCSENEKKTEEINDEEEKDTNADLTECNSTDSDKKSSDSDFKVQRPKRTYSGLSNTLNILSDDEDDVPKKATIETENKCVDIEDDDDVMVIDDEVATKDDKNESKNIEEIVERDSENNDMCNVDINKNEEKQDDEESESLNKNETTDSTETFADIEKPAINEKIEEKALTGQIEERKPLVPTNFLKTFKKNIGEMTRDELEEFCLLKIVEGVVDRSNLSEIKGKLKILSQNIEEWRKKALMLTKQNRDLQIVLKTVQEEQKKKIDVPIAPLKITRSVGMQVYMADGNERGVKRKAPSQSPQTTKNKSAVNANTSTPTKASKQNNNNAPIPVPRLVPASNNSPAKNTRSPQVQNSTVSSNSEKASPAPVPNGVKNSTPPVKAAEKRNFSSVQSDTVDLTDDEPPSKQMTTSRNSSQAQPVRLINQNQLLTPRAQSFNQQVMNGPGPRKVYIPINQNQAPMMRPGQTIMLKSCPQNATRPRANAPMIRLPGPMRIARPPTAMRHPAPLPTVAKQQQPPNWKALPPAPDLKISKVENGIVISWKIEGYQEDSYETIASYQLYAYQETSSPSTLLWKKIGDVKALPLPMACTLTQFVAGYKYYFAVRAVDIRSRIGPFSLPGSILLLNK